MGLIIGLEVFMPIELDMEGRDPPVDPPRDMEGKELFIGGKEL